MLLNGFSTSSGYVITIEVNYEAVEMTQTCRKSMSFDVPYTHYTDDNTVPLESEINKLCRQYYWEPAPLNRAQLYLLFSFCFYQSIMFVSLNCMFFGLGKMVPFFTELLVCTPQCGPTVFQSNPANNTCRRRWIIEITALQMVMLVKVLMTVIESQIFSYINKTSDFA